MLLMQLMIIIGGVYWWGTKWSTMGFVCVMYLAIGAIGNALHMSFHVRKFHLEEYAWYRELRTLHYIHHLGDMKSNMGMLNLVLVDGLTGSLQTTDPIKNQHIEQNVFTGLKNRADKDFP
jgi:sterol desaturase/sphingolipid hydroxylase (fatty acid hydroxylase superfamily)